MKFIIEKKDLVNIFSEFINILKENPVKPVISGLKIEVADNEVIFTGTNLDVNYIKTIKCDVKEKGIVILKPNLPLEYIKLLDNEKIELELKKDILLIHKAEFSILSEDNFPEDLILPVENKIMEIEAKELIKSFEKTKFSASQSAENLAINCIRVVFAKDRVSFISTDSYRLTYLRTSNKAEMDIGCSIPLEEVNILTKLLKDLDEKVCIGINKENIIFQWKDSYFLAKLVTLQYPNFEGILCGNSFSKEMEFNYEDFKSSLKKVMMVARTSSESKNGAILDFTGKKLSISAFSGKAKINQKVDMIKNGEDFKCSLNIKFLFEFVDNLSKNVIIRGNSSSSMFEITESENDVYKYILMPLALRD